LLKTSAEVEVRISKTLFTGEEADIAVSLTAWLYRRKLIKSPSEVEDRKKNWKRD